MYPLQASQHRRLHNADSYGEEFDPQAHGAAIRASLRCRAMLRRFSDPAERARHAQAMMRAWAADDGSRRTSQAEVTRQIKIRSEITAERVQRALHVTGSIRGAAQLLNCDRTVFRRFPDAIARFRGDARHRNHKVAVIRELP